MKRDDDAFKLSIDFIANAARKEVDAKFNQLEKNLTRAKKMVTDAWKDNSTSFTDSYNDAINETLTRLKKVREEAVEKVGIFIRNMAQGKGIEGFNQYLNEVIRSLNIESRVEDLTNTVPMLFQLAAYQSKHKNYRFQIKILNKLCHRITEEFGVSSEILFAFADDFALFPLIDDKRVIVSIPISARDSYSKWIFLAHELGHWLYNSTRFKNIRNKLAELIVTHSGGQFPEEFERNWLEEIFSDFIMTELFSIQAYQSSVRARLFKSGETPGEDHPPHTLRGIMIAKYLRKRWDKDPTLRALGDTKGILFPTTIPKKNQPLWIDDTFLEAIIDLFIDTIENHGIEHRGDEILEIYMKVKMGISIESYDLISVIGAAAELDQSSEDTSEIYTQMNAMVNL